MLYLDKEEQVTQYTSGFILLQFYLSWGLIVLYPLSKQVSVKGQGYDHMVN